MAAASGRGVYPDDARELDVGWGELRNDGAESSIPVAPGKFDPFAAPSGNDGYLRAADNPCRRSLAVEIVRSPRGQISPIVLALVVGRSNRDATTGLGRWTWADGVSLRRLFGFCYPF